MEKKALSQLAEKVRKLFGAWDVTVYADEDAFELEHPEEPVNIGTLLQTCGLLGITPSQLLFNADMYGSGCPTCGDTPYQVLRFKILPEHSPVNSVG